MSTTFIPTAPASSSFVSIGVMDEFNPPVPLTLHFASGIRLSGIDIVFSDTPAGARVSHQKGH
jgi:hypothetical protein